MRRHDPRSVLEAGAAIGNYTAKRWIGEIDVPTSVLVTTEDRAIVPERQLEMADAIPGATVHEHRRRPHRLHAPRLRPTPPRRPARTSPPAIASVPAA